MEFSRDEVRRQLIASEADQKMAMRPWREALLRVFGTDNEIPASARAQMLGVPSRRGFLKIGGATVLGAAVLAACGSDAQPEVAESGSAANATTTTVAAAAAETDLVLLRTATSLEVLAVNTYQAAIDSGLVTTADIASAATLFRDQHDEHAGALQAVTESLAPGQSYDRPNSFVQENVIDPAIADLTDEASVVELALTLETAAAETYTYAAGVLSTPTLRQAIMGIGGVEARHMAVLRGLLTDEQVPVAFMPTDDAITEDAFVGSGSGGGGTTTTTGN